MRTLILVLVILSVPIASTCLSQTPSPQNSSPGLILSISTPKLTYVIGEPIRIDAVLTNESMRTIWICDIGCEIPFDFEVRCPNGGLERVAVCGIVSSNCGTVPLPPGSGTYQAVHPTTASKETFGAGSCAFAVRGEHRVRLVYRSMPDDNKYVGDLEVTSNELVLRFAQPDSAEREILGALSHSAKARGETKWCLEYYQRADLDLLHRVVALYPEHPTANYARIQLVRYLALDEADVALRLLLDIVDRDPEFWFEEVRIMIARQTRYVHRASDAVPYLMEALRRRPLIITNPAWGLEFALAAGGLPGDTNPMADYRVRRERGELRVEDYLAADSLKSQ